MVRHRRRSPLSKRVAIVAPDISERPCSRADGVSSLCTEDRRQAFLDFADKGGWSKHYKIATLLFARSRIQNKVSEVSVRVDGSELPTLGHGY